MKVFFLDKVTFLTSQVLMTENLWRPFHSCINYQCRTDIDEAKVISALQHKSKYKSKLNFELISKEIHIFGFPRCCTREDLSIDASITNVGLLLTKLRWFLFPGYGQTDTVLESSYGNMSAHTKFQLKVQN